MAPKIKKAKEPTPWPMKSCSATEVFAFFSWPDHQIYQARYKSLLDAGQQAWHSVLYPEIDTILNSGKETFYRNDAEPVIVSRLMTDLKDLLVWGGDLVNSVHWKPLCRHITYWSKRRYLASNVWKTLLLRRRRISLRTLPIRTVDSLRRRGWKKAGQRDEPIYDDRSGPLNPTAAGLAETPSLNLAPPFPPPFAPFLPPPSAAEFDQLSSLHYPPPLFAAASSSLNFAGLW